MTRKRLRQFLPLVLGSLLFLWSLRYILLTFQWESIFLTLHQANLFLLLGGGSLTLLVYFFLRSLRWYMLLRATNHPIRFLDLYFCNTSAMFLTITTPFQSGEVVKVELLKRRNLLDRHLGYGSFLVERVMDLLVVAAIATLVIMFSLDLGINRSILVYVWITFLFVLAIALLSLGQLRRITALQRLIENIQKSTRRPTTLLWVIFLTIMAWLMVAVSWQFCLASIKIYLDFWSTVGMVAVVTMINILSFVPGAIGVSEVGITQYLLRLGFDPVLAQSGAVILRVFALLMIVLSLAHWLIWKHYVSRLSSKPGNL